MAEPKIRKPPKVACHGPCGEKYEREDLTPVGPKRRLCQACLLAEAEALAEAQAAPLPDRERVFRSLPNVPGTEWPGRSGRLSPSELSKFLTCPEQWRQKNILGRREPSSGRQMAGNAAHAAAEVFWTRKLEGDTLSLPDVRATGFAAFDAEVEKAAGKEGDRYIDWQEPMTRDAAREASGYMAMRYIEEVGDRITPVSMEAVSVAWVPGVPIPIASVADLIRGEDGVEVAIVDTKFGARAHESHASYWTVQGLVQQLGRDLACEWHSVDYMGKVNTPDNAPALRVERSAARFLIAAELVRTTYKTIMMFHDHFGPYNEWPGARSNPQACSMCSFVNSCSWWTAESFLTAAAIL